MQLDYDKLIQHFREAYPEKYKDLSQLDTEAALAEITFIITSAIHAKSWAEGQATLQEFKECGAEDDRTHAWSIVGTVPAIFALATIKILELMAQLGTTFGMLNSHMVNTAPRCFAPEKREFLAPFVWDLVRTLAHYSREDCDALEVLKLYEKNPGDKGLESAAEEIPEELRTVHDYFNYMLSSKLSPVVASMAAWCKVHEGIGLGDVVCSRLREQSE